MKDNSGQGDSKNNLRDPTLKEHVTEGIPQQRKGDFTSGADADEIVGNARERGEDPSPSSRARGETSTANDPDA
jgi:hypothetical protein